MVSLAVYREAFKWLGNLRPPREYSVLSVLSSFHSGDFATVCAGSGAPLKSLLHPASLHLAAPSHQVFLWSLQVLISVQPHLLTS